MIEAKRQRTQWFYNATWGLWSHYLGRSAGQGCIQSCINGTDDWQRRIDRFNVTKTAEQLASVGARYFFITIGQNSGAKNRLFRDLFILKTRIFAKTDSGQT
jgi:hypothetical protein